MRGAYRGWAGIWLGLSAALALAAGCKPSGLQGTGGAGSSPPPNTAPAALAAATTTPAGAPAARSAGAPGALVAFPGAEGFGAHATGGRGGAVCAVTSLAKSGPGTLASCLAGKAPRTVVFRVSGVIDGPIEMTTGNVTIAGQTAPGGITIRGGLVCDNVYDKNDCANVVIRHVRLRGGAPDSLRLGGTHDVVVDHCSLSTAEDENLELTRSHRISIQYSIIAEPRGDHYKWGGVLINYSKDVMPLDELSLHHDVWNGVAGRVPEISCEENGDGPGTTNCSGRALRLDLVNNVVWDTIDPIWFNRCTGTNEGNDCPVSAKSFALDLNLVGNVMARRSLGDSDAPMIEPHAWEGASRIAARDNRLLLGGAVKPVERSAGATPHASAITAAPAAEVVALLARRAGAFPRDAMDKRLAGYLAKPIDARPAAWRGEAGVDVGDGFSPPAAGAAPPDADADGIPDDWEAKHGLDPKRADGASLDLGKRASNGVAGCTSGYTALECYLNELAERRLAE